MHVRFHGACSISSDAEGAKRDRGNENVESAFATVPDGGMWSRTVPAPSADLLLEMPGVNAGRLLFVKTKAAAGQTATPSITIKINGTGNTPIAIAPGDDGEGVLLLATSALASLHVSVAGVVPVEVTWAAAD